MYLMYKIGKNSKVIANKIDIDDSVIIGDNVFIECDTIKIGKFSKISDTSLALSLIKSRFFIAFCPFSLAICHLLNFSFSVVIHNIFYS